MIQLPSDFTKWVYVDIKNERLLLHLHNYIHQYFTHVHTLDKAMTLDEHLRVLETTDFSNSSAYVINPSTLETVKTETSHDQHWAPAPVPIADVVSLAQYRALKGLPDAE